MEGSVVLRIRKYQDTDPTDYELDEEYSVDDAQGDINEAIENRHNVQLIGRDGEIVGGKDGIDPMQMAVISVMEPGDMTGKSHGA